MRSVRPAFLPLWTLAVAATVARSSCTSRCAAARCSSATSSAGRGRSRRDLREVKRVLELEAASYKTPERVEIVARTLLGMEPPPPDRIVAIPALPQSAGETPAPVLGMNGTTAREGLP